MQVSGQDSPGVSCSAWAKQSRQGVLAHWTATICGIGDRTGMEPAPPMSRRVSRLWTQLGALWYSLLREGAGGRQTGP